MNLVFCCVRLPAESESGFWGWRLSHDHRPDDEAEEERINDTGGFIARGRYFVVFLDHVIRYGDAEFVFPVGFLEF